MKLYARHYKIFIIPIIVVVLCSFLSMAAFAVDNIPDQINISYVYQGSGEATLSNYRRINPGLSFQMDDESIMSCYGGILDVINSSLYVNRICIDLTGNESIQFLTNNNRFYVDFSSYPAYIYDQFYLNSSNSICSNGEFIANVNQPSDRTPFNYRLGTASNIIFYDDNIFQDVESFSSYLRSQYNNNTPVQLSYLIQNPYTIQLSESELYNALIDLGYNPDPPVPPDPPIPDNPNLTDYWDFIGSFFGQLFSFNLPWGIAFGSVVVGIFGAPLIVKAYKKFF